MEWQYFNMIENLSNSIMVPIAGVILAIVMTVDLIQMIADKNNLHDVDTWMIFKGLSMLFIHSQHKEGQHNQHHTHSRYTVLLCFTLFKTGSLAKSVFQAH